MTRSRKTGGPAKDIHELRDSLVAGLHREGGWVIEPGELKIERMGGRRFRISAVVKDRDEEGL